MLPLWVELALILLGASVAVRCDYLLRTADERMSELQATLCFDGIVVGWTLAGATLLLIVVEAAT